VCLRIEEAESRVKTLRNNSVETSKEHLQTLEELGQVKAKLELLEAKETMRAIDKCPECVVKDESINDLEAELKAETQAKFRIMGQIADMMGYKPR
jgi:hypothetical protein